MRIISDVTTPYHIRRLLGVTENTQLSKTVCTLYIVHFCQTLILSANYLLIFF